MIYIIEDWYGNKLMIHGDFKTFQDAWDYIRGDMTEKYKLTEEDYQEYFVTRIKGEVS